MSELFTGKTKIRVSAFLACERIDLRGLETTHRLATAPLVVSAGDNGCAVMFRYGVILIVAEIGLTLYEMFFRG